MDTLNSTKEQTAIDRMRSAWQSQSVQNPAVSPPDQSSKLRHSSCHPQLPVHWVRFAEFLDINPEASPQAVVALDNDAMQPVPRALEVISIRSQTVLSISSNTESEFGCAAHVNYINKQLMKDINGTQSAPRAHARKRLKKGTYNVSLTTQNWLKEAAMTNQVLVRPKLKK